MNDGKGVIMKRTQFCCYLFVIISIVFLNACTGKDEVVLAEMSDQDAADEVVKDDLPAQDTVEQIPVESIVIYICGEVHNPGVYELPGDSRLYQAIDAAGGLLATAADTYLNQAQVLSDGQSIYVPDLEEAAESGRTDQTELPGATSENTKININTATLEELMTLTGIGEAKALSIIEYRNTNGRFQNIEDIKSIPGIKDGVFQKIKDQISV